MPEENDGATAEIAKEIKSGEKWLIGIGLATLIINTGIALIYWGQLKQMRTATDAATKASKTAAETLQEMRTGGGATDTHTLASAASEQAKNTEDFFRTDERAWVEFGKIEKTIPLPPPSLGLNYIYGFYPTNVGKTVAKDVRIHIQNTNGVTSLGSAKKFIKMSQDQLFRDDKTKKLIKNPDNPGPQTLAPNETSPVPIYSGGQEPQYATTNVFETFIIGRIDYIDAFGAKHWKRFCYEVSHGGDLYHCQYGNEEDNNPEPKAP